VTRQLGQWCHLHKSLTAMYWLALGALTTDMIPRVFLTCIFNETWDILLTIHDAC
jgi:hypothetical protein